MESLRILVAEDHPLFRKGIVSPLSSRSWQSCRQTLSNLVLCSWPVALAELSTNPSRRIPHSTPLLAFSQSVIRRR